MRNGAQVLLQTLVGSGITTCFTNPGTSEIHLVAALDSVPEMRAILTLFEGVATGAADGFARMTDAPACTLLHLGPGLGNGLANLHNARRAKVPVVNIVGDHATYHTQYDVPLQSDIETVARSVSPWVRTSMKSDELARDAVEAISAAISTPRQVATLIVPADVSWEDASGPVGPAPQVSPLAASDEIIDAVAQRIRGGDRIAILLGGRAAREPGLTAAARVAAATGAKLLVERTTARIERGAGLPAVERLAHWPEIVSRQLAGLKHLVVADAKPPAAPFAAPGLKSSLVPDGCEVHELAPAPFDVVASLEALVEALGVGGAEPVRQAPSRPPRPHGPLTAEKACQAIGAMLPEGAIISDEAITSVAALPANTAGAPRHDWLTLAGGAIGQGLPVAVGAAIACPDRPVIALEADGSALYTIQSLWTMAREQLDVTVVIFNNRSYAILATELGRIGTDAGPRAKELLELGRPDLDFVKLGNGFGVPSRRVDTADELVDALDQALAEPGPSLIEAILPRP